MTKISFDYAVVEKESSIQVLRYSGDWKDVGTWNMMAEVMADKTKGKAVLDETCENTNVVNELNIPILCMGCKDMIVAASGDGILIADMDNYGNPHSDYLWILFEGGIIALVIFAVLLIIIGRKSERVENSIERYTFAAFVCFMIMMLDDDHIFRSQYMLVIPSLCYHASFINNAANGR